MNMADASAQPDEQVQLRAQALERLFADIARTRMAGLPVMNPALQVAAVDFQRARLQPAGDAPGAWGVLLTPWFMNLVWMPLQAQAHPDTGGTARVRRIGDEEFLFASASEPAFGCFEACSMFSPMFEFRTQGDAISTAHALLRQLRASELRAMPPAPVKATVTAPPSGRRAFLFGRGTAGAQRA